jgi:hypothetical protein
MPELRTLWAIIIGPGRLGDLFPIRARFTALVIGVQTLIAFPAALAALLDTEFTFIGLPVFLVAFPLLVLVAIALSSFIIGMLAGPNVDEWSIAVASFVPTIAVAPFEFAFSLLPQGIAEGAVALATWAALFWSAAIVYFGVRWTSPGRAVPSALVWFTLGAVLLVLLPTPHAA